MKSPLRAGDPSGNPLSTSPEAAISAPVNGVVHLSKPLAETIVRLALAGVEPALGLEDWPVVLGCSRREIEKMKSSGRLPAPDFHVGRLPRWHAATVRAWLLTNAKGAEGGRNDASR